MNMVTGLFRDRDSAERAYECAMKAGYESAAISLVMTDATRDKYFSITEPDTDLDTKAAEGAGKRQSGTQLGGPLGGTIGTIAPVFAAVGVVLLLPGFGIVAAGPIAVALAAAGTVGVAGGLIGALTHWGIPSERLEQYEAGVRDGGILMGLETRSHEDVRLIELQWTAAGGEFVHA